MRNVISLVVVAILSSAAGATPIDVYIFSGQSNAVGGANVRYLPPGESALKLPQASLYQHEISDGVTSSWQQLAPRPDGAINAYFGAELTFAQAMERRTGQPIAIIKVAFNATILATHWLPGIENGLYEIMLNKVTSSLSQFDSLGYEPRLSGFIWIQGEGDAGYPSHSAVYDDNLLTLASAVRSDLGAPELPFLYNQAHVQLNRAFAGAVRQGQQNAAAMPNMLMVNADDQALNPDLVHFTTEMHVELGRRFADALLPSGDFNDDGVVDGADLAAWKDSFGSDRVGDGNADQVADGADFLLWQRQVNGGPPFSPVPEPAPLALAAWGLLFSFAGRRFLPKLI